MIEKEIKIGKDELGLFGLFLLGNGTLDDMRTTKGILEKVETKRTDQNYAGSCSFSEKEIDLILSIINTRDVQGAIDIRTIPLIEKFLTEDTQL